MLLYELLSGVSHKGGTEFTRKINVVGIATDSRMVRPGYVFVCISGTRTDGHAYAAEAVERGAVAIVSERTVDVGVPEIIVDSTRSAAAFMWSNYYGRPWDGMKVIAVTGTNGKTSVTFMIRHILQTAGYRCGLIGTVECSAGCEIIDVGGGSEISGAAAAMTTPDPEYLYGLMRRMKNLGVTHVIMEASSHSLAQHKLDPISVDVAVFTGLSHEHLDFHGTMENYLSAKSALFRTAKGRIINADDPYSGKLCELVPGKYTTVGTENGMCDFSAVNIARAAAGVTYDLSLKNGGACFVGCAMPGMIGVYNSALAIAAATECGADFEMACRSFGCFRGVPGRMETVARFDGLTVIRDFAHTPEAMKNVLEILGCGKNGGKLWIVFGCGGDRDPAKRPLMGRIASEMADVTVVTSDNCRSENRGKIISDIMQGIDESKPHIVIPDREEAVRFAVMNAEDGDTVVLCGKGHEDYEITAEGKRPFDEVKIVLSAIDERKRRSGNK